MIRGCSDKATEAGISIVGGHTMDDLSPKCGLSVTGYIPKGSSFIPKSGAAVGDVVLLTKPLGIGIYTTAIDKGMVSEQQIDEVAEWMMKLNKESYDKELSKEMEWLFYDPQTSGGLLTVLPSSQVDLVMKELEKRNGYAAPVGVVKEKSEFSIHIKEAK